MKNLLIFTFSEDPHTSAITKYLSEDKYFVVNTNQIHDRYSISFYSDNFKYKIIDRKDGKELSLDENWNIWNRRILDLDLPPNIPKSLSEIINNETKRTIESLMFSHTGKVINDPRNNYRARSKLDQLIIGSNIGCVTIPNTLVSNNPNEIRRFYQEHQKICFKLQKGTVFELNGENQTVMTNIVKEEDLESDEILMQGPHLFQEYCEKDYEIRVTTIGNKSIGVAIYSQDSAISKIDFRRYDFNVPYRHIELPRNVEDFCFKMLEHYGLGYGCFDFIFKDGNYTFLELNPNGQWLWLEKLSGYELSKYFASYLIQ